MSAERMKGFNELFKERLHQELERVVTKAYEETISKFRTTFLSKICGDVSKSASLDAKYASTASKIDEVFEYWKKVMEHPKAKMDHARRYKLEAALKLKYEVDELKMAIDGCAKTPFNMGQNDYSKIYDGINLIFRNADSIERFIKNATSRHISTEERIFNALTTNGREDEQGIN